MANPTLFIAGGATPDANVGPIQTFMEMDSTVSLQTQFSGNLTTHPVESGARIADHLTRENPRFTLRGVTSNTPVVTNDYNEIQSVGNRTQNVYSLLRSMYENAHFFTLVADLDSYSNCLITRWGFTQEVDSAEALYVDIEIEQIRVAVSETVYSQLVIEDSKADDSAGTTDGGTKSGKEADTSPESHSWQILRGLR